MAATESSGFIRSEETSGSLASAVTAACDTLRRLLAPDAEHQQTIPTMPTSAITASQGLAFTHTTRAALGVGIVHGEGFVIARISSGGGRSRWSAPSFFTINKMTLGLSYGMGTVDSVLALGDRTAVDAFIFGQPIFGASSKVLVSREESAPPLPAGSVTPYSVSDVYGALLVDISVQGGALLIDQPRIEAVYGNGANPTALLAGQFPPPQEFKELYGLLAHYEQAHAVPSVRQDKVLTGTPLPVNIGQAPQGMEQRLTEQSGS